MKTMPTRRSVVSDAFGLNDAPVLFARTLHKPTLNVTEVRCDQPDFGMTKPIPRDDAYLLALQIRECPQHELWEQGRAAPVTPHRAGASSIFDLRRDPIALVKSPFHSLHFYIPQRALDQIAEEAGAARIAELPARPGVGADDPVARHLLTSLLPALARPDEACPVFVDHVSLALVAHVAHVYGGMRAPSGAPRGGLAPHLQRRAEELFSANLSGEISLARVAAECGLSVRHFARAFRKSAGVPPHRWLLQRRVEQAKALLRDSASSLAEIALACGFADQSHFTRVFTAMAGVSPGAWRRLRP